MSAFGSKARAVTEAIFGGLCEHRRRALLLGRNPA
jgi:hypothetical protein